MNNDTSHPVALAIWTIDSSPKVRIAAEREVYKGKRGKCSVSYGVLTADEAGKARVVPCEHRTLRTRPVHEVTLPNGIKIEVPR